MMQVRPQPRSPLAPAPDWEPLCSEFDPGEERFLVNCSQSTFCMTRTHTLHIRNGEISIPSIATIIMIHSIVCSMLMAMFSVKIKV